MSLDNHFWKDRVVFLTGHTGFVGSWMSLWLDKLGAKVYGFSENPKTQPNLFSIFFSQKSASSKIADIANFDELNDFVSQIEPEVFFHLAAQPLVGYSYRHPIETVRTNVLGTTHVLESFRISKTAKILVNITTDKCYENVNQKVLYKESDRLGGHDLYSASKTCSEFITSSYRDSFFNLSSFSQHQKAVATARAGNIIGGGDWSEDRLIPDIIQNALSRTKVKIRNPQALRPWQFILDPIYGYLLLAQSLWKSPLKFSGAWNFGPKREDCKCVEEVINKISQLWPSKIEWENLETFKDYHEANLLMLNSDKAKNHLLWQAQFSFDEMLTLTTDWYERYYRSENMIDFSLEQIDLYFEKLKKNAAAISN